MFASVDSPQRIRRARRAATAIMLLLVAGCATRQSVQLPAIDSWEARASVLGNYANWEFSARIGVKAQDDGFNGNLRWTQAGEAFHVTVGGPLGIGTVKIDGDGPLLALTDKDGVRTELSDIDMELKNRYGWTIPVQSLRYWALGIPDPSMPARKVFNTDGELTRLEQQNWTVLITRYRDAGGQPMPSQLTASNADTRVRIVIDKWLFFD
jgi:outer membrane lipoprotein LolB